MNHIIDNGKKIVQGAKLLPLKALIDSQVIILLKGINKLSPG